MGWSEMLPEVLDIIAQKHITCYEDYPSFACVCKSWRLAAARTHHNSNGPPSRFPSLMLEKRGDHESRELFLLSNKSIRKIRLHEAYGKMCRSSCGWLLTVDKDFTSSQLINPLSREIINLPKLDTLSKFINRSLIYGPILKVVLLMESKLVFVIWNDYNLAFCHIGDNKWTSVEESFDEVIIDITFYNGKVYTLSHDNKIQACNVNGKDEAILVDVAVTPYVESPVYIVGLDDGERKQLLVIISIENEIETYSFQVLAYDLESGNWSKVKDFDKKTLFVGYSASFWVEDTTGVIKGDCIYYAHGMGDDMRIYHLLDGTTETIEPHYFAGQSRSLVTPPLWLQSV